MRVGAGAAMVPLVQAATQAFHARYPRSEPSVKEARSSVAIHDVIEGGLDLAFTSRPLRTADVEEAAKKKREVHMTVIAAEAVAVIVHPDNPIQDIGSEALKKIFFTGALRDWSEITDGKKSGPIHVFAVNPKTSGTGELFVSSIASGGDKSAYASDATLIDYSDATVERVAKDPNSISFSGMSNVHASVKALTINGVAATEKAILDTSYILNRKLFAVSRGVPRGNAREFVKFLLSDAGQTLSREKGVTPIVLD